MNTHFSVLPLLVAALAIMTACNSGPKVITSSSEQEAPVATSSGIFSEEPMYQAQFDSPKSFSEDLHTVTVNEVLPTAKYVYLNVNEGENQFWIATGKQEIKKGATYFYRGGLLKTNFESKEYKRIFDKIYLVSSLVAENHGSNTLPTLSQNSISASPAPENVPSAAPRKGSIKIADLVKNPKKYEGKTVQISGKCVKVNPNIMNRNWIHIQDGSQDDFDLVITSSSQVAVGAQLTMEAVVVLNKDFGAGYRYDLILENGTIVP